MTAAAAARSRDTRQKVRLPPGRAARPVPAQLAELAAAWTRGRELRPVAQLRTTRVVRDLTGSASDTLAEVADGRVTASRAARPAPGQPAGDEPAWDEPVRWREIEVELAAGGPPGLLDSAGQRLTQAGARPARSASKLHRLMAAAALVAAAATPR